MKEFIPPKFNLPLAWSVDFTYQRLLKLYQKIEDIEISAEDKKTLRDLRKKRALICCNHPSQAEPFIAYHIANVMGTRFNYMAYREMFDQGYGVIGRIISRLGAFSFSQSGIDRYSIKTAIKILSQPKGKLLLFPEGEVATGENDSLWPFQPGLFGLGFRALEQIEQEVAGATLDNDIIILPTFIKYIYPGSELKVKGDLHTSLGKIEKELALDPGNKNILSRFLSVGRAILKKAEQDYRIEVAEDRQDFDYRVNLIANTILDRLADSLPLSGYSRDSDLVSRLRYLKGVLEASQVAAKHGESALIGDELERKRVRRELQKAHHFIMVKPEYLISRPTAERFYEWLHHYEYYLYGTHTNRNRNARVILGTPFSLAEYRSKFQEDRRATRRELTAKLRDEMMRLLEESLDLSMPIVRPYDAGGDII